MRSIRLRAALLSLALLLASSAANAGPINASPLATSPLVGDERLVATQYPTTTPKTVNVTPTQIKDYSASAITSLPNLTSAPNLTVIGTGNNTVQAAGMAAGGQDNSPFLQTLMNQFTGPNTGGAGYQVNFPNTPGVPLTEYYFSQPFSMSRSGVIDCGSAGFRTHSVILVFAAGVDGPVWENNTTSADGGFSVAQFQNCGVYTLGSGTAHITNGSGTLTGVSLNSVGSISAGSFAVGDGIIISPGGGRAAPEQPTAVPGGTYVASVSGSTIILADGVTSMADSNAGANYIYRLPGPLADLGNTTSGSNIITITSGTTCFRSGDLIWMKGFTFGATVFTATGACGAQTLTMNINFLNTTAANSTVTATGNRIWLVPSGLHRRNEGTAINNYVFGFPISLNMACTSGGGVNCTGSNDTGNGFEYGIFGRWVSGNNSGGSSSHQNIYVNFFVSDIFEGGTVGSNYVSDESNSGSRNSSYPVIGNCVNQNYSPFSGMYIDTPWQGTWLYCHPQNGAQPHLFEGALNVVPTDSVSSIDGALSGHYQFKNLATIFNVSSGTYNSGTGAVSLTTDATNIGVGDSFSLFQLYGTGDVWQLNNAFTATAGTGGGTINFTAPTGLTMTIGSAQGAKAGQRTTCFYPNSGNSWFYWGFSSDCTTFNTLGWTYNNGLWSLDIGNFGPAQILGFGDFNYTGYAGDANGYLIFPRGFILNAHGTNLFNNASSIPGVSTNKRGDFAFNSAPSAGGIAAWIDTADGTNFKPAALIANDAGGVSWNLPEVISTGSVPTPSGTCSVNTQVGGATAGSFKANGACAAGTVILTFPVAAPNGWTCDAHDNTTPADAMNQTAYSTTSCTLTGSMASADVVTFRAVGF